MYVSHRFVYIPFVSNGTSHIFSIFYPEWWISIVFRARWIICSGAFGCLGLETDSSGEIQVCSFGFRSREFPGFFISHSSSCPLVVRAVWHVAPSELSTAISRQGKLSAIHCLRVKGELTVIIMMSFYNFTMRNDIKFVSHSDWCHRPPWFSPGISSHHWLDHRKITCWNSPILTWW